MLIDAFYCIKISNGKNIEFRIWRKEQSKQRVGDREQLFTVVSFSMFTETKKKPIETLKKKKKRQKRKKLVKTVFEAANSI